MQQLAARLKAVHLRIDSIEQAIRSAGADVGAAGYFIAYRLATENLQIGSMVIVDSVNPMKITRDAYKDVALSAGVRFLEVEVVCSDKEEHRHRIETPHSTVEGLTLPAWE